MLFWKVFVYEEKEQFSHLCRHVYIVRGVEPYFITFSFVIFSRVFLNVLYVSLTSCPHSLTLSHILGRLWNGMSQFLAHIKNIMLFLKIFYVKKIFLYKHPFEIIEDMISTTPSINLIHHSMIDDDIDVDIMQDCYPKYKIKRHFCTF